MFPENPINNQPYRGEWIYNEALNAWVRKRTKFDIIRSGKVCDWNVVGLDSAYGIVMANLMHYLGRVLYGRNDGAKRSWFRLRRWGPGVDDYTEFFKNGYTDKNELINWVVDHILHSGPPDYQSQCQMILDVLEVIDYEIPTFDLSPIPFAFSYIAGKRKCKTSDYAFAQCSDETFLRNLAIDLYNRFFGIDVSSFNTDTLQRSLWVPSKKRYSVGTLSSEIWLGGVYNGSNAGERMVYDLNASTFVPLYTPSATGNYLVGEPVIVIFAFDDSHFYATSTDSLTPGYPWQYDLFRGWSLETNSRCSGIIAFPVTYSNYRGVFLKAFSQDSITLDYEVNRRGLMLQCVFEHNNKSRLLYNLGVSRFFDIETRSEPISVSYFVNDGLYAGTSRVDGSAGSSTLRRVRFRFKDPATNFVSMYTKQFLKAVYRTDLKIFHWKMVG